MSYCIANLSCSSPFIVISCCDFRSVTRLSWLSLLCALFSLLFFNRHSVLPQFIFIWFVLFFFAGSVAAVSVELQRANVLAESERAELDLDEMSLEIAVSETNLGFTLWLNPRKESKIWKNSDFSQPLPVALVVVIDAFILVEKALPVFF